MEMKECFLKFSLEQLDVNQYLVLNFNHLVQILISLLSYTIHFHVRGTLQ